MIDIPTAVMDALWALILAVIGWVMAYINSQKAQEATEEKKAVETFYDPQTGNTPAPASVPERAWKMNDETKRWLTVGHSETEKAQLLQQVAEAEAAGKTDYYIGYANGWYHINFGLIMGSAKGA